ncbi:hypothetical protein BGZ68_007614 [Mortierella alpina]|nr:hypothetical protein BGZ68_007614 [Mortierella alpina]
MAGHKDLYQSMQGRSGTSDDFTNLNASIDDACLNRNTDTGRVTKYRVGAGNKRSRSISSSGLVGDLPHPIQFPSQGEGARWEGQLKRVREPASVELDRAMVQFLKSPAAVDSHGRRLNDAELQSHALRLARTIPSASRMRCSFGWLRHFKRRLGVQWAADRLGRYRWIVEMDPSASATSPSPSTSPSLTSVSSTSRIDGLSASPTASDSTPFSADTGLSAGHGHHHQSFHRRLSHPQSQRQGKVKEELDDSDNRDTQLRNHHLHQQLYAYGPTQDNGAEDESGRHSSQELLGRDYDFSIPVSNSISANAFTGTDRHMRSTSTSTSQTCASGLNLGSQYQQQQQQHQARLQQRRLYSFSESSPFPPLGGPFSSASSSIPQPALHVPSSSLAHPSHSTFLNLQSPLPSLPSGSQQSHQSQPSQQSILDSFPNLFDSLPPLHSSSSSTISTSIPASVPSSQIILQSQQPLAPMSNSPSTSSVAVSAGGKLSSSPFALTTDGGMRKVPNKDEAYEMLQGLLLYYEQDNHNYTGEQQTLLLPRWIHQQRQIMQHTDEGDARMVWMRQQQQQQPSALASQQQQSYNQPSQASPSSSPPFLSSSAPGPPSPFSQQLVPLQATAQTQHPHHPLAGQSLSHPHSNFPQAQQYSPATSATGIAAPSPPQHRASSHSSSPPLSPLSTASPATSTITVASMNGSTGHGGTPVSGPLGLGSPGSGANGPAGLDHPHHSSFQVSSAYPSLTSSIEQQMFYAHQQVLQQQFALQHQHQQQMQQQQQQQQHHQRQQQQQQQ